MISNSIPHSRPWITEDDRAKVDTVLRSGMIARGNMTRDLEKGVSSYLEVGTAISTSSGTAALFLALKVLLINRSDEVIVPTYVCRSVLEAVLSIGAVPVICDVNHQGVLTYDTVSPHITKKTRAIIAVHIFGHPCDIGALKFFDIPIIEDACQSFGLTVNGKAAGTSGHIGFLSFSATKCLTTGEGGMLITDDDEISLRAYNFAHGSEKPNARANAPMSDLQAALGLAQLSRYSSFLARRNSIREKYNQTIDYLPSVSSVCNSGNYIFRYVMKVDSDHRDFDSIQMEFLRKGIQVRRGVDELLHRNYNLSDMRYPNATSLYNTIISIPFYPALDNKDVEKICGAMRCVFT